MRRFVQLGQKLFALAFRDSCPDTSLIERLYRADLAIALVNGESRLKDVSNETEVLAESVQERWPRPMHKLDGMT